MPLLPHISVAIPLMDELENLPALVECLNKQTYRNFSVYVCVNQPESWWEDEAKRQICANNADSITFLQTVDTFSL